MRISLRGFAGPLAQATAGELKSRGHIIEDHAPECIIFFPGPIAELESLIAKGGFDRLVLRSHAYAYGASPKNPGYLTESRASLLAKNAPEQFWLWAERVALRFRKTAVVRLTNVLHAEEGDLFVSKLASRAAISLAGYDPNMQCISVSDAARALAAAAESNASGLFNAAARGAIPLKKALRASRTTRIPAPRSFFRLFDDRSIDQLRYNWTVSPERASRELNFEASLTCAQALREFLRYKKGARPETVEESYDDWGLDEDYITAWSAWFTLLRKIYWRIEFEGLENIPPQGRAIFVSNHRGFMPLDAVMHLYLVRAYRQRTIRFLIIHSLLNVPFLCNFLTKLGGVIASQENAARLFAGENLVGIFPEGIRGAFSEYGSAYRPRDFAKSAFAKLAIENQAPIIPAAVIGHAEIFPILGKIHWPWFSRKYGWPFFPIAPPFPLLPTPIPSKWHIRVLPPVELKGLGPADADEPRILSDVSRYIQSILQANIDQMLSRRTSTFAGRILDGSAPPRPALQVSEKRLSAASERAVALLKRYQPDQPI